MRSGGCLYLGIDLGLDVGLDPGVHAGLQTRNKLVAVCQLGGHAVEHSIDLVHAVAAQPDTEPQLVEVARSQRLVGQVHRTPVRMDIGHEVAASRGDRGDHEQNPQASEDKDDVHTADRARQEDFVTLRLGSREFGTDSHAVMAIVNRTPDSFFDQGATYDEAAALARVATCVEEGADIIDIGGIRAGTGPPVSVAEELRRTESFVALVRQGFPDVLISVDTWRAEVASALVTAGADLINDTWAGADPELVDVAAQHGVGLVCSHTGGLPPRTDPHRVSYPDVVKDVITGTTKLAQRAVARGVRPDGIIVDPTHDFGKNTWHSLELTRRLDEVVATGWPVLAAVSNKDFIGETLDLPVSDRLEGSLAAVAVAAWLGARVFRTHHVRATRRVVDMVASIRGVRPPAVARRGLA